MHQESGIYMKLLIQEKENEHELTTNIKLLLLCMYELLLKYIDYNACNYYCNTSALNIESMRVAYIS